MCVMSVTPPWRGSNDHPPFLFACSGGICGINLCLRARVSIAVIFPSVVRRTRECSRSVFISGPDWTSADRNVGDEQYPHNHDGHNADAEDEYCERHLIIVIPAWPH
jgi:hypothetical protein